MNFHKAQDEASSEEEDIIHEATDPSAVPGPDQIPNDGSSVTNNRPTEETSHNSEELDFGEIDPNWDLDDTLKCIKCDSRLSGKRCFRVDNPQNFKKCRSTEGLCYTLLLNGDILRGCIGDSILPYIDSYEFTLNSIKLCNNNLCNKENMEDTCVVCEGDGCNDLATIQQDDMQRVCSFGKEPSGCFLRINKDNSHQRGCVVDLSETEKTMCQTSISTKCQSCFKPNCNKKLDLYQKCYFCNGTTDNNCHRLTSHHTKITCIKYGTQCLVGIDEAGFTHRGCSSNSDEHELLFPIGYTLCDGDLCNRNLFPDNRVQCYACNIGMFYDVQECLEIFYDLQNFFFHSYVFCMIFQEVDAMVCIRHIPNGECTLVDIFQLNVFRIK